MTQRMTREARGHDMFELKIETGNAAFYDDYDAETPAPGPELARILRDLADDFENSDPSGTGGVLLDVNGNRVGSWVHSND